MDDPEDCGEDSIRRIADAAHPVADLSHLRKLLDETTISLGGWRSIIRDLLAELAYVRGERDYLVAAQRGDGTGLLAVRAWHDKDHL